ncbi:MAG: PqqD family protein [Acidobacteriota bacterium]|jgi:hypothetical protein
MKPVARKSGLLLRELADEVVVYDQERHEAHCLNRTAALVFRNADGRRSVTDLAALLSPESAPGAEGLVEMALEQLSGAHLLENAPPPVPEAALARRDVMRRVGIGAAVLLPLVSSVLAPSPAEAAATCVDGNGGGCVGNDGANCHCGVPSECPGICVCSGGTCVGGCTPNPSCS